MPRIWTYLPKLLFPGGVVPGHAGLARYGYKPGTAIDITSFLRIACGCVLAALCTQFTVAAEARLEGRQSGQPRDSCYILNSHKFPREEKYERHY